MKNVLLAAAVFALAFSPEVAPAQGLDQQSAYCDNKDGAFAPDLVIGGCTALIQSGRLTGRNLANAFYTRGGVYKDSPQPDSARAIADYTQAIALYPLDADFFNMRGLAYEYSTPPDYARAMADFNQAIVLNPKLRQAFSNRGNVYQEMPQPDYTRAIAEYDQAIALDPKYAGAFNNRGIAYQAGPQPDYARAIADFDQAGLLDPDEASYQNRRCWARALANQDLDVARSACDAALRISPQYAATLDSRGLVGLKQARFQDAWSDYNAAVEINATHASYLFGRGVAALHLWRIPQGLDDIAKAKKLDGSIEETYAGYGVKPPIGDGPVTYMILGGVTVVVLLAFGFAVLGLVKRRRNADPALAEPAVAQVESDLRKGDATTEKPKGKIKVVPLLIGGVTVAAVAVAAFLFWPHGQGTGTPPPTETADASSADEPNMCSPIPNDSVSIDQRIAACTDIIKSGKVQGADLAQIYQSRGLFYVNPMNKNIDRTSAVADFGEAIKLDPQSAGAYLNRAGSLAILKDYDRALADANTGIKLTDTTKEAGFFPYATLGKVYFLKGDYAQASAAFEQVSKIADGLDATKEMGQAQGLYGRGIVALKTGRTAAGQADIAKAEALFSNVENFFIAYGMTPSGIASAAPASTATSAAASAAGKPGSLGQVETKNVDQALNPDWNSYFADRSEYRWPKISITRPPEMRPRFSDMHLWISALGTGQAPPVYVVNVFDESAKIVTFDCPIPTEAKSCDQLWREKGASVIALARAIKTGSAP